MRLPAGEFNYSFPSTFPINFVALKLSHFRLLPNASPTIRQQCVANVRSSTSIAWSVAYLSSSEAPLMKCLRYW